MNKTFLTTTGPDAIHNGPDPISIAPGALLTNATLNTDTTVTVVAGAQYVLQVMSVGNFYLGIADVTTAANVMWACGKSDSIVLEIPSGYTTLHYATDTNDGTAYLIRIR